MYIVYRDSKFEKSLGSLKQSDGTGAGAARRAEALIERLARADGRCISEICRLTRNGEARIRNCRKYDLGEGYRLITICKGRHLVLIYVGSHDDCDRWLKRNRGFMPVIGQEAYELSAEASRPPDEDVLAVSANEEDEYEKRLMEKITERDLRYVFRGFWDRTEKNSSQDDEEPPLLLDKGAKKRP